MKFKLGLGLAAALFAVQAWFVAPASALPTPGQMGCAAAGCSGEVRDQGLVQTVQSRGRMGGGSMYRSPGRSYGGYRGGYRGGSSVYRGAYRGGAYRGAYRGGSRYYRGNRAYRSAYRGPGRYARSGRYYRKPGVRANRAWSRYAGRYPYRYRYGRYSRYPYPYWGYGVGFGYGGYDPYYYDDPYYGYGDGYGVYGDADASVNGDSDYIAYCSRKYRSFNPATGLFRTYSGRYKRCAYTG